MSRAAMLLVTILCTMTIGATTVTLTSETGEVTLQNGDVLTGSGGFDTRVKIADGATVTLNGVNITRILNNYSHIWPGIECLGDAVINLEAETVNNVKGGVYNPGIFVPKDKTLTISGDGSLNATGSDWGAGIGSCNKGSCGNITITSGTVTANGGLYGAGIGSGFDRSSCGKITISGGTVTATGGLDGAGIGSGYNHSSCGKTTISGGTVTATGGESGAGIGSGCMQSSCDKITISGGTVTATWEFL